MNRTVYLNGDYLPETEAKVSIFDRGFLMADGVYEVTSVLDGKLIDFAGHAKRLERSLDELDMVSPVTMDELLSIHRELVTRNGINEGLIYLQITRGAPADRDFAFPARTLANLDFRAQRHAEFLLEGRQLVTLSSRFFLARTVVTVVC